MINLLKLHHQQNQYEIMKDPAFLSSPIYPPIKPTKPQLSTTRDDYLVPILSTNRFSFKSQLTSLYMHPTDYTFKFCDKNQDFFASIASKIMAPNQYWLENGIMKNKLSIKNWNETVSQTFKLKKRCTIVNLQKT